MTAPQRSSPPSTPSRPKPDAIERLYVYWLVSTVLLTLVVLLVAIMTRGTLHRQTQLVGELADRLGHMEQTVRDLQSAGGPETVAPAGQPAEAAPPVGSGQPSSGQPRPASESPQVVAPAATPPIPAPTQDVIGAQLDQVVSDDPVTPGDVVEPDAAAELVETALTHVGRANWDGATWSRLAVLARLLGRDVAAEAFARRAAAAGEWLINYAEVSVRSLLARGRAREALPIAADLIERSQGSVTSRVLLAAACLDNDDPGSADEVLEALPVPAVLSTYDKLLLARALLGLEHWDRLEAVLGTLHEVPPELAAEHNFLAGASLARAGRTVEALAIFDGLSGVGQGSALSYPEGGATEASAGRPTEAWPILRPDRYQIEVWRGVTLMLAQQTEAARQVLQRAAELDPGRPGAHYYLGVLEARAGRPEVAKSHLKNALASSARMAPAWEALAHLEIEDRQVDLALQHLAQAIDINPRRASAHFLTAIAYAKISQAEPAAQALRAAFRLDQKYLSEAKQTEVLLRLFTAEELDELAGEPAQEPATQPPAGPAPQR
jgi:tetratricopeptide (TPR) repeat protein